VIKVTRPRRGPAVLTSQAALDEQAAAKAHYDVEENLKKEFKFTVYQHRAVRDALEQLFRMKCAYCETSIGAGDESEIEHWRPKGAVKEDDGRRAFPAYYWRAATWQNLLLSCLKCNRPRKYRLEGGEEDEEKWERSGKGMLFPLAKDDTRATSLESEKEEHPLLLDPCRDDPAKYLEFVVMDADAKRKALIRTKEDRGRKRERADRSIDVYSLNRPLLVRRRRRELMALQRDLADFKVAMETFDALPAGPLRENQAQLMRSSVEAIAERLKPESEYLLMTKQAIADFLDRNQGVRRRLDDALGGG
jgi:uncharacterized protein (TIGR02646 family)